MFCILRKKENGNDKKNPRNVGPTEITKSNVGRRQGRGCQGSKRCAGWQGLGGTEGAHPGSLSSENRGWVRLGTPSGSSGQPVPQSRGSAQPDGSQQVFCQLSISRMVLVHRNHIPGGTAQSSPCPHSLWGPTGSPTGLSPAQDTDLSPETRCGGTASRVSPFPKPVPSSEMPLPFNITHNPGTVSNAADSNSHQNWLLVRDVPSQGHRELRHVVNHGNLSSCSRSPPQAPILLPQMGRGGKKWTWKKIEAMAFGCFLPLFFLGCLI